jgi:hypothetical protein
VTFSVLGLNVLCGVLGALVFSLAIWFRSETKVRAWVNDLEMYQYYTGLYILMVAGAIIIFISICGCVGAVQSNSCLLATSAVLVLIALILELTGGIFTLVHGTQSSKLTPWLDRKFSRLVVDSNYDTRALNLLNNIQENVGCCGSYNYQDYNRNRLPIPESCRDKITGNVHSEGCIKRFATFIEKRTGWISGIALFVGFLQIMLVGLTFIYWKRAREEEQSDSYRDTKYSSVAVNPRY